MVFNVTLHTYRHRQSHQHRWSRQRWWSHQCQHQLNNIRGVGLHPWGPLRRATQHWCWSEQVSTFPFFHTAFAITFFHSRNCLKRIHVFSSLSSLADSMLSRVDASYNNDDLDDDSNTNLIMCDECENIWVRFSQCLQDVNWDDDAGVIVPSSTVQLVKWHHRNPLLQPSLYRYRWQWWKWRQRRIASKKYSKNIIFF